MTLTCGLAVSVQFLGIFKEFVEGSMKIDTGKFSRVSYQIIILLNITLNQIKDHQRTFLFPLLNLVLERK